MITVNFVTSGQQSKALSVAEGFSLKSLLSQEGHPTPDSVSLNGEPNPPMDHVLEDMDTVFVTRSNKGGRN